VVGRCVEPNAKSIFTPGPYLNLLRAQSINHPAGKSRNFQPRFTRMRLKVFDENEVGRKAVGVPQDIQ
jgi:hypothetical protein